MAATIASACITQSSISYFVMPLAALAKRSTKAGQMRIMRSADGQS
ncbi:hypothetical protein AB395_00006595 (plasmid) [Sinorhizobium fredii CCBAU 45436]|nr:hypothetical protein AB395_00006595 [Sinorhizobium fredii CCBAU 45436]